MRKIMNPLLALQKLQFGAGAKTRASQARMETLRAEVPPPILAHYDRLVSRGKKGVAVAREGSCSECHLQLTKGRLLGLAAGSDVQICDNCGRYLSLPEEISARLTSPETTQPAPVKPPRKTAAHQGA